jgi:hypothetical protein
MAQVKGGGKYTVKAGDNLWDIAVSIFGDGKFMKTISNANDGMTTIRPGQVLKIPWVNKNFTPTIYNSEAEKFGLGQQREDGTYVGGVGDTGGGGGGGIEGADPRIGEGGVVDLTAEGAPKHVGLTGYERDQLKARSIQDNFVTQAQEERPGQLAAQGIDFQSSMGSYQSEEDKWRSFAQSQFKPQYTPPKKGGDVGGNRTPLPGSAPMGGITPSGAPGSLGSLGPSQPSQPKPTIDTFESERRKLINRQKMEQGADYFKPADPSGTFSPTTIKYIEQQYEKEVGKNDNFDAWVASYAPMYISGINKVADAMSGELSGLFIGEDGQLRVSSPEDVQLKHIPEVVRQDPNFPVSPEKLTLMGYELNEQESYWRWNPNMVGDVGYSNFVTDPVDDAVGIVSGGGSGGTYGGGGGGGGYPNRVGTRTNQGGGSYAPRLNGLINWRGVGFG